MGSGDDDGDGMEISSVEVEVVCGMSEGSL